jgi:hypothetical protein
MSGSVADKFKTFVNNGGTLIADSEIANYDCSDDKRIKCRLENLFGVEFLNSFRQYPSYNYFCLEKDYAFTDRITRFPMAPMQLEINPIEAESVAKSCPKLAGCYAGKPQGPLYPFITVKQNGGGYAYYIGGVFFEYYKEFTHPSHRWLLESLLNRHCQPKFKLIGATESVEFSVRRSGSSTVFALVNFTSAIRPIEHVPAIHGMKIKSRLKFNTAKSMTTGEILQLQSDGTIILLPAVHEYEFIVAE